MGAGAATAVVPIATADVTANWLEVNETTLELPKWDANGFRVALVSDLHVNSDRQAKLAKRAFEIAVESKPDLIAIPGDFVNFSDSTRLAFIRSALEPLKEARCPIVATMGNHDFGTAHPHIVIECVRRLGVTVLRNELVDVDGVSIVGIDDALWKLHRPRVIDSMTTSKSLLALFHEPDFVSEMPGVVSLQVSGHSHGGQVCLPGGIALHTPLGARRYISGFYPEARAPLFVTKGVGTVGPNLRFFCRPEVAILTVNGTS